MAEKPQQSPIEAAAAALREAQAPLPSGIFGTAQFANMQQQRQFNIERAQAELQAQRGTAAGLAAQQQMAGPFFNPAQQNPNAMYEMVSGGVSPADAAQFAFQGSPAFVQQEMAKAQGLRTITDLLSPEQLDAIAGRQQRSWLTNSAGGREIALASEQIINLLGDGQVAQTPLQSLGAVIKLAKILDPNSVVREGEVTTVEGGNGLGSMLMNSYNKMFGEGFSEETVYAFKRTVNDLAGPALGQLVRQRSEFIEQTKLFDPTGLSGQYITGGGVNWEFVNVFLEELNNAGR